MPDRFTNITNVTPPRVPLTDARTGLISREWYRFFLNMFQLVGQGQNQISLLDVQYGPPAGTANPSDTGNPSIAPDPLPGELLSTTAEMQKQIYGLEMGRAPQLGTMAQLQQAWLPWVTFDTAPEIVPPDVGTVAWDGGTTLGVQMTANVVGRVNESGYYYIKASSTITKGQVVMFTGAVGVSGVPTGAPATGVTDGSYIMGVAAESIALNGFGLVQFQGTLRGVNLSAYTDGDILWYDPAVTGGLTKTKPSAPNVKVQMAAVVSAANNGTLLIRVNAGSVLGGTDSNVQFGTLANGDLIQYDSTAGYWKNVPATTVGVTTFSAGTTGLTPSSATAGAVTLAGTLKIANGGTGVTTTPSNGQLLIGNGTGYTVANLTAGSGVSITNSAGGISISATGTGGTVTSVGLAMPTQFIVTNSPVTGSGTLTAAWNNQTANAVFAGPTTGSAAAPTFRSLVAADIPSLSYVTSVGATAPITSTGGLTPTIGVTAAALTKTDDTNVTMTLGGSPTTALLAATSLTLGWTGQLGLTRGGTNASLTAVAGGVIYSTASALAVSAAGTSGGWLKSGGTGAPTWASPAALTKTDDTNVTLTLGGSASTALLNAASLTLGWTGQLSVARGGTGVATATANTVFAGPTSGAAAAPSFRALVASDIPTLSYVTSVTGASPVVSSGGTTPAISLASGYGDTQNPYASKTANYFLAAPNGSAGAPTFRAIVAADIPTLPYQPTAAPVTYTANFSVAATDVWIINNKSGSSCTATLPTASSNSGRVLRFQNYQAQTLVSASSNVVQVGGGAATTSILLASAGDQCTLVSDGTNWIMMQYVPNNILLLE